MEDPEDGSQIMEYLEGAGVHFVSSKKYDRYTMRKAVDSSGGVSLILIRSVQTAVFLDAYICNCAVMISI